LPKKVAQLDLGPKSCTVVPRVITRAIEVRDGTPRKRLTN
jgi:hypothetical protein